MDAKEGVIVRVVEDAPPKGTGAAAAGAKGAAEPAPATISALFRFSTTYDLFLITAACLCAGIHGVIMPLFSLLFGQVVNGLNTTGSIMSTVPSLCLQIMGLALAGGASAFLQVSLANVSAVRQVRVLRSAYVGALLRQDLAWADAHPPGEAAARISEDTAAFEEGIGMKLSMIAQSAVTFLAGIILAFSLSWRMSLVLLGFLPFLGGVMALITQLVLGTDKKSGDAYAEAGEVATEALSNIRTVAAYGGEATLAQRYDAALGSAEAEGVKKAALTGLTFGTFLMTLFTVYGVCLLWGAQLVLWSRGDNAACAFDPTTPGCFTGGTVMQVLFALIMGAGALGQLAPSVTALTAARAAGGRIFEVLDRVPGIDSGAAAADADAALPPPPPLPAALAKRGRIEFRNVTFAYPTRPTVPVLTGFNLVVEAGQSLALVGPSGCGKSTLIALAQRWYDCSEGAVLVDGVDVREWPVQALRAQQALVSQESLLLAGTVAHNLELGALGGGRGRGALARPELEAAARQANAHDFIAALPQGYDTQLMNASLSGGQRQRLCIARALLRTHASVLLLDEATSALDTRSERAVQEALDSLLSSAGARRTSLTIAHRLSTIDGADRVVVMSDGRIVEDGAPGALMAVAGGVFRGMREAQDKSHAGAGGGAAGAGAAGAAAADASAAAAAAAAPALAAAAAAAATEAPAASGAAKADADAVPLLVDEGEPAFPAVPWSRVAALNAPELLHAVLGVLSCAVTGATMPAFALILSRFIAIYYNPDGGALWRDAIFYMCMFLLIGGANFVFCIVQQYTFGVLGERLVRRARSAAFGSILRFETAWHDAHPPGAVTSLLGANAYLLRAATGPSLALNIQNLIGLAAGLAIAFSASWQITLVVLCVAPLIALGGMLALRFATRSVDESMKAFEASGAVATEALSAPRTVAAYGLQAASLAAYSAALEVPTSANMANAWISGMGMGIMALMMIGTYAIIFGVGAVFIDRGILNFQDLLTAMFGVMFAATGMGNANGVGLDAAKAATATSTLFGLMDRKPKVPLLPPADASAATAATTPPARAALAIKDVTLQYRGRAGAPPALNSLSLDIPAGTFVALVGASGCGKSSVVSLLLRLYEPSSGSVTVNGEDIRALPLAALRAHFAWVQQEPNLFNSSIAYNIGFPALQPPGAPPAPTPEQLARVHAAARQSGAHDFVSALPQGYDTLCGTRGSQLSGGQKQRLCIARALLRSAPVLLLDEATSALDSASEALVQASLDALLEAKRAEGAGTTVLVIAHRLSTIKAADMVVVMDAGRVVESGTYAALSAKEGGAFKSMLALQGLV